LPQGRFRKHTVVRAGLIGTATSLVALAVVAGVSSHSDPAASEVRAGAVGRPMPLAPPAALPGAVATDPAPPVASTRPPTTAPARAATPTARPRRPGPGTVQFFTMASGDSDGRRRSFWIYRPGVPDSADLPVLYFLHGYPGNERAVAQSDLAWTLERLFAAGVKPFVVVAPNGQSSTRPDTEWADAADGKVRLETYIVDHLIPAVEGVNRRDRTHRAVAGFSMGGFGAMNLGLRHPDLFGHVVSIAGYYRVDDPSGMGRRDPRWEDANSPDHHVAAGAGSRILLVTAAGEHDPLIAGEAQRYRRLAEAAGQHPALVVAPGSHTFDLVVAQLPAVARFLAGGW
jgi:S-formylglutathione hydrolase FrmB